MRIAVVLTCTWGALLCACSESAATSATRSASKAEINYKARLLPLIVGVYSGECKKLPDSVRADGVVNVGADGRISTAGVQENLLDRDTSFVFSRKLDGNGPVSAKFGGGGHDKQWAFGLESGVGEVAGAVTGNTGVECEKSGATPALKGKGLRAPIAQFLVTAPVALGCAKPDNSFQVLNYEVRGADARLGDQAYTFDQGLKTENVTVANDDGALTYAMATLDGRSLTIQLDNKGTLTNVNAVVAGGVSYFCTPQ